MIEKKIKISSIQIKNFRSIRNIIVYPKDFNIFVGLNDAGKSNVLKALNLFFTGETDYGQKFSFKRDFTYLFPEKSHSKKEVKIIIKFDIPDTYTESGEYTWEKTWGVENYATEKIINPEGNNPNPKSRVPGALRRIKYRYVPAVKSQDYYKTLLGDLYTAVFSSIDNPLAESVNVFSSALKDYTGDLSSNIQKRLEMESILSFPDDLNDIFKALVFETSSNSSAMHIPLTSRGDGIQVRHIPVILKYIAHEDQKSRNKGSMKICTIWGFEEPENGLELLKTFKLANEFDEYSKEIQMFVSTHSPAFYMKKESESSKVFFVSKNAGSDETEIFTGKDNQVLADSMGLMPLVAPFIKSESQKLLEAEQIYKKNILTDVPTILVEGETDIEYLKIAITEHSESLSSMLNDGKLRIICKNDGAGTKVLEDWVFAWIYSGFRSKIMVLLDKDEAGIKARNDIIENEIYKSRQNASHLKVNFIEPSNEIMLIRQKHILFDFEIEHLLSTTFWNKMTDAGLTQKRSDKSLCRMFSTLVPRNKTLDEVMVELIEDESIRSTILEREPKDKKKNKIVELLKKDENKKAVTEGFLKTVQELEKFFCS